MTTPSSSSNDGNERKKPNFNRNLEPSLWENPNKYAAFPVKWPDIWEMYKRALASLWVVEKVDLSKDLADWSNKLMNNMYDLIPRILSSFTLLEREINIHFLKRFGQEIQVPEVQAFYDLQVSIKNTHLKMHSLLIDTYHGRDSFLSAVYHNPTNTFLHIAPRAEWALKWINNESTTFAERIVVIAAVESIFFSSGFASILQLKKGELMPGLTSSIELIQRDKSVHCDFICRLFKHIVQKPSNERVISIIQGAVAQEQEFLTSGLLPLQMMGMDKQLTCRYVEFVADRLLDKFGIPKIYMQENLFDFMEISTDFGQEFEAKKKKSNSTVFLEMEQSLPEEKRNNLVLELTESLKDMESLNNMYQLDPNAVKWHDCHLKVCKVLDGILQIGIEDIELTENEKNSIGPLLLPSLVLIKTHIDHCSDNLSKYLDTRLFRILSSVHFLYDSFGNIQVNGVLLKTLLVEVNFEETKRCLKDAVYNNGVFGGVYEEDGVWIRWEGYSKEVAKGKNLADRLRFKHPWWQLIYNSALGEATV